MFLLRDYWYDIQLMWNETEQRNELYERRREADSGCQESSR